MGSREKLARWLKTQAADVSAALQSDAPASANAQVWCIIEQVPTWHLALTSPSPSGWERAVTCVTVRVTPLRTDPGPGVMGAIRGHGAHARHQPQRWQTGTCALCKLHEKNKCFKSSVNISEEKKKKIKIRAFVQLFISLNSIWESVWSACEEASSVALGQLLNISADPSTSSSTKYYLEVTLCVLCVFSPVCVPWHL